MLIDLLFDKATYVPNQIVRPIKGRLGPKVQHLPLALDGPPIMRALLFLVSYLASAGTAWAKTSLRFGACDTRNPLYRTSIQGHPLYITVSYMFIASYALDSPIHITPSISNPSRVNMLINSDCLPHT